MGCQLSSNRRISTSSPQKVSSRIHPLPKIVIQSPKSNRSSENDPGNYMIEEDDSRGLKNTSDPSQASSIESEKPAKAVIRPLLTGGLNEKNKKRAFPTPDIYNQDSALDSTSPHPGYNSELGMSDDDDELISQVIVESPSNFELDMAPDEIDPYSPMNFNTPRNYSEGQSFPLRIHSTDNSPNYQNPSPDLLTDFVKKKRPVSRPSIILSLEEISEENENGVSSSDLSELRELESSQKRQIRPYSNDLDFSKIGEQKVKSQEIGGSISTIKSLTSLAGKNELFQGSENGLGPIPEKDSFNEQSPIKPTMTMDDSFNFERPSDTRELIKCCTMSEDGKSLDSLSRSSSDSEQVLQNVAQLQKSLIEKGISRKPSIELRYSPGEESQPKFCLVRKDTSGSKATKKDRKEVEKRYRSSPQLMVLEKDLTTLRTNQRRKTSTCSNLKESRIILASRKGFEKKIVLGVDLLAKLKSEQKIKSGRRMKKRTSVS